MLFGLSSAGARAEDAGARALQQQQLQRQQQQEALQLRLQQQQQSVQSPPRDARGGSARERTHIEQRQRLQSLHDRQSAAPEPAQPSDDEGTRRAKAQLELLKAQRQSEQEGRAVPLPAAASSGRPAAAAPAQPAAR